MDLRVLADDGYDHLDNLTSEKIHEVFVKGVLLSWLVVGGHLVVHFLKFRIELHCLDGHLLGESQDTVAHKVADSSASTGESGSRSS